MNWKAWFLLGLLAAGILWPLGRIWESWHRQPSTCPPSLGVAGPCPVAESGCGSFKPMLNATCPKCGRVWFDSKAPEFTWTERALDFSPRSRYPTVFSEPRICAMEEIYGGFLWRP
jgi:hypothetical protein